MCDNHKIHHKQMLSHSVVAELMTITPHKRRMYQVQVLVQHTCWQSPLAESSLAKVPLGSPYRALQKQMVNFHSLLVHVS